ncbi:MAG TPA: FAD-binding oxidoreductase [Candidatus Binataceae bacterium]|jgi:D-arginine dehydrogenase|nr:FAD-binding oxidoreductase [Candidatus Binataceae bacterium]
MDTYDFIIVGGGIAGASAAYELAAHARVLVLERETQPGYHTTGRSAALFVQTHGPAVIRALSRAAKDFFLNPPNGFAEHPLLTERGMLLIGRSDQSAMLEQNFAQSSRHIAGVRRLDATQACTLVPLLREEYVAGAVLDPEAMDMDVHAIHWGFIRGMRARGGKLVTSAELLGLERNVDGWIARTTAGDFAAPVVINAAGAWCDVVGAMASAGPIGLVPKRRTAFIFDPPPAAEIAKWPSVIDVGEEFYFKPDAGKFLGSPADQTPMEPCDVQPDDFDVALAVDRIQRAARIPVAHVNRKWAGLRSFVADGCPVVGYDPRVEGFFWLAGQGGYGIETSPSMGRLTASLALGRAVPPDLAQQGVTEAAVSPARIARARP